VDTSAWVALHKLRRLKPDHPSVAEFAAALTAGQLRGSDAVKLELLHSARSADELTAAEAELDKLQTLPITANASRAAVGALRDLAATCTQSEPLRYRLSHLDALIAASAWHTGIGVIHYDAHYDTLAEVLNIPSVWFAPRKTFAALST
jgi:predicted nucleic acid-binding protein